MKKLILLAIFSLIPLFVIGQMISNSSNLVGGFGIGYGKFLNEEISINHEPLYSVHFEIGLKFDKKLYPKYGGNPYYLKNDFLIFYEYIISNPLDITSTGLKYQIYFAENNRNKFYMGLIAGIKCGYTQFNESFEVKDFSSYNGIISGINFGFIFFKPISLIVGFNYDQYHCFNPLEESIISNNSFGKLSFEMKFLVNIKDRRF